MPPEYQRVILAGVTLGVVAALVVWWLERFQTQRLISELEEYLRRSDVVDELRRRTE